MVIAEDEHGNTLEFQWSDNKIFVHCTVKKWTVSIYKDFKKRFEDLINYLRSQGVSELYAVPTDENAAKFDRLFGFSVDPDLKALHDGQVKDIYKKVI